IRPDGYVKVLDFGLAKLNEDATTSLADEIPTIQVRTGPGIVIGTVAYMSPEQARGLSVDHRSDIFSLGAVIYEMLARRKAFEGDTPSDTLASILKTEPPSLLRFAPDVPPELERLVTNALHKDREERYQSVKDVCLDLKTLKEELEFKNRLGRSAESEDNNTASMQGQATTLSGALSTRPVSVISRMTEFVSTEIKRHKLRMALALIAVILIATVGGLELYQWLNRDTQARHFSGVKLTAVTNSGNTIDATISPDGKYIVYALSDGGLQSLYIRQVSTANDKLILPPAPTELWGMTFSPDGTELYYAVKANRDAGTLYHIPILGGTPVKVLEKIDGPISFSPDGRHFVLVRANYPNPGESALVIANIDGSGERNLVVKKLPQRLAPLFFTGPSWSPDNKIIAATVMTVGGHKQSNRFLGR
ncbi:MAG TPA: protein kinase, partial [Pyrinomonadaceae bacterium]|nr:protein kinase [Pyrinomonadaceae bacterium]